ncbi:MAG: iron chelate uptake ABC transporter family permease subunit [Sphingobium sp.]
MTVIPHARRKVWRSGHLSLLFYPRAFMVQAALIAALAVLTLFALNMGRIEISFAQIAAILTGTSQDEALGRIIIHIRIPRIVTACGAGAALGISGAIFQSVSRNILGSPDVIGFLTGAATGAIGWIILVGQSPLPVAAAAVCGGLLTAGVVYLLALRDGGVASHRLVLVGIGVGSILSALNGLLLAYGKLDTAVMANLWLAGSLNARNWGHALPVALGVLVLTPVAMLLARSLHLMEMGDDIARQLGVRVERCRLAGIGIAVVLAALATGAAGPIAFIALAAPQIARHLTREGDMPTLTAALVGAVLLMLADTVTQSLPLSATLPIGRVTGLVGGAYLAWLITRSKAL